MPGINEQNSMKIDADYQDVISFKTIFEMEDPVMSPHTGHIYDRADIELWAKQWGNDPIARDKKLTSEMLVSGRFVRQIADESSKKFEARIQKMEESHKKDFDELRSLMMTVVGQNTKLKAENETLTSQVTSLKSENESLKKENQQLRSGYVNPMWTKHGSEIDRKLKKGSSSERTDALKDYAAKVKEAYGDIALQQAVNAADKFKEPQFAKPRFFAKFVKTSETSRVATEFQAKVSQELGW